MTTYVLIPGACHGAWCFDDLADELRSRGHRVLAITLTGIAERAHLLHAGVNLETHVADVLAELAVHGVTGAVLVGHSYGGMVITAVADRVPQQVDSLVYLDALVPTDGESCWHLVNDEERQWYLDVDDTGYGVPPMPFFDPRASAHPLASFLQRIRLTGDLNRFRRRDFVYALKWPGDSPLRPSYERVRNDPNWITHELDGAHNLMRDNPDDLLRILLDVAGGQYAGRAPGSPGPAVEPGGGGPS
jgi:pimeloyl-ACP methyl ester carboxylesterase